MALRFKSYVTLACRVFHLPTLHIGKVTDTAHIHTRPVSTPQPSHPASVPGFARVCADCSCSRCNLSRPTTCVQRCKCVAPAAGRGVVTASKADHSDTCVNFTPTCMRMSSAKRTCAHRTLHKRLKKGTYDLGKKSKRLVCMGSVRLWSQAGACRPARRRRRGAELAARARARWRSGRATR